MILGHTLNPRNLLEIGARNRGFMCLHHQCGTHGKKVWAVVSISTELCKYEKGWGLSAKSLGAKQVNAQKGFAGSRRGI